MGAYGNTAQASRGKGGMVYHVDINGSDDNDGLTRQRAFEHIQKAIETAASGDTILVWPGIYTEAINFTGKAVTVQSAADAAIIQAPEYMGQKLDAVTFHTAEELCHPKQRNCRVAELSKQPDTDAVDDCGQQLRHSGLRCGGSGRSQARHQQLHLPPQQRRRSLPGRP